MPRDESDDTAPPRATSPRPPLRCWLVARLSGWVTMVFVSSALIVLRGVPNEMTRDGFGRAGWMPATWRVADEMSPAAKLLLVILFAVLVWLSEQWGARSRPRPLGWAAARNGGAAVGAMIVTLALVPATYSRGFGIGLTGARFDAAVLPLYLVSAVVGGVAYTVSRTRCGSAAAAA